MARRIKLTNNSDESEIASVLSGDSVFSIPFFQRPYKWKPERVNQFQKDVLEVVDTILDHNPDTHFLGAIIIHGRRRNPSDPTVFDVIDGQQRLTTIFIFLSAIIRTLCRANKQDEALGLFQKYIALGRQSGLASNVKLHPGRDDRKQLNLVMTDLLSDPVFKSKLGTYTPLPLPDSGPEKGPLRKNYNAICRFLDSQLDQSGIERINDITRAVLDYVSVVQIDVVDPTNGPKIFDSLNSRQEPMTVGDLIRNEIFSRAADKSVEEITRIDNDHWQPFYNRFKQHDTNLFDSYFFPYGLIKNPNLGKSEVYSYLREQWKSYSSPTDIINELATYQNAYIDLATGQNLQQHTRTVALLFRRLHDLGAPASSFPFLMHLSQACKSDDIRDEGTAASLLLVIESFLVRRAIVGIEPTGLHAVFKRLWSDINGEYTIEALKKEITKHTTVKWPTSDEVKTAIKTRPLYGASVTKYLVLEYDKSLGGDAPGIDPWLEHILPETLSPEWSGIVTTEDHDALKDTLGNLIPLSSQMNQSLSNSSFPAKSERYKGDAAFKSARKIADENLSWGANEIRARGETLADWAVTRWKY